MLDTAPTPSAATRHAIAPVAARNPAEAEQRESSRRVSEMLQRVQERLAPQRRMVHAGDSIYQAGQAFAQLYLLNTGMVKVVNVAADGREQVVGLRFGGDWLGFDGIASGRYAGDAIAMDTGEVWQLRYDALLRASSADPELLQTLHQAMSREIGLDRESLMSVCTLPADARVADFLRNWVEALARRGLRTDQITLRMTRAEIGNHLGMTLETVSRSMSRLVRAQLIRFGENHRRDIHIAEPGALAAYVQRSLALAQPTLQ